MARALAARVIRSHARTPSIAGIVPFRPAYLLHRVTCQNIEDDRDAGVHRRIHGAAGGRAHHRLVVASSAAHLGKRRKGATGEGYTCAREITRSLECSRPENAYIVVASV